MSMDRLGNEIRPDLEAIKEFAAKISEYIYLVKSGQKQYDDVSYEVYQLYNEYYSEVDEEASKDTISVIHSAFSY